MKNDTRLDAALDADAVFIVSEIQDGYSDEAERLRVNSHDKCAKVSRELIDYFRSTNDRYNLGICVREISANLTDHCYYVVAFYPLNDCDFVGFKKSFDSFIDHAVRAMEEAADSYREARVVNISDKQIFKLLGVLVREKLFYLDKNSRSVSEKAFPCSPAMDVALEQSAIADKTVKTDAEGNFRKESVGKISSIGLKRKGGTLGDIKLVPTEGAGSESAITLKVPRSIHHEDGVQYRMICELFISGCDVRVIYEPFVSRLGGEPKPGLLVSITEQSTKSGGGRRGKGSNTI